MDIQEISLITISNENNHVLYSKNFDNLNEEEVLRSIRKDGDSVCSYKDKIAFVSTQNDVVISMLVKEESNEIMMYNAFQVLIETYTKLIKTWSIERVNRKYDQLVIATNEFVYEGVLLTDNLDVLKKRVLKRSFENLDGIKMKKGLASFIHKATKPLSKK